MVNALGCVGCGATDNAAGGRGFCNVFPDKSCYNRNYHSESPVHMQVTSTIRVLDTYLKRRPVSCFELLIGLVRVNLVIVSFPASIHTNHEMHTMPVTKTNGDPKVEEIGFLFGAEGCLPGVGNPREQSIAVLCVFPSEETIFDSGIHTA